jgi:glycosyltransferase involved in cell wall biosynthesis
MNPSLQRRASSADIALLLEGSFPYVRCAASEWVLQMLQGFPEYRFALVFLGGRRADHGEACYALPENVVHFEAHYLHDVPPPAPHSESTLRQRVRAGLARIAARDGATRAAFERLAQLHELLLQGDAADAQVLNQLLCELMAAKPECGGGVHIDRCAAAAPMQSRSAWAFITAAYERGGGELPFTDYFRSVRIMHRPLWQLSRIGAALPPARVYHATSSAYAGLLGALVHLRCGQPLLASEHRAEHGAEHAAEYEARYWAEHEGEHQAEHQAERGEAPIAPPHGHRPDCAEARRHDAIQAHYWRTVRLCFFEALARVCYRSAQRIVALDSDTRARQLRQGATPEKIHLVGPGVALERYAPLRLQRPADAPLVVALIAHVAPLKDIKTFVRAVFIANRHLPGVQGWVLGAADPYPDYAQECRELADGLGLRDHFKMLGAQSSATWLPKIGVAVLSSLSEGVPQALLEALAAGVPVVATDVCACRALVDGRDGADRALGSAGAIVPVADPERLADAMLALLCHPERWRAAQQAGIARVERYYAQARMVREYRALYRALMVPGDSDGYDGCAVAQAAS